MESNRKRTLDVDSIFVIIVILGLGFIIYTIDSRTKSVTVKLNEYAESAANPETLTISTLTYKDESGEEVILEDVSHISDGSGWFREASNIVVTQNNRTVTNIGTGTPYNVTKITIPNPDYIERVK